MAEAEMDRSVAGIATTPARRRSPWLTGLACFAMLPLLGYIGQAGLTLWDEWGLLRIEQGSERRSTLIGYLNITPNPSYASRPDDWLHDEGDHTLLWAGWKNGENHWFRFKRGHLDVDGLSLPIGRDSIQAIDYPVYEQVGGPVWARVPGEDLVYGFQGDGTATAYPLKVLDKVEVVNDQIDGRAVLIALTPKIDAVSIYEASVDGRRVTLGHGGYFFGHRPVLYDRGSQSLWSEEERGMVAIAGHHKGASLKRIARLDVVSWADWRAQHPDGRLVIGADRSQPPPID